MPGVPRPPEWGHEFEGIDQVAQFVEQFTAEESAAIWRDDGAGKSGAFGIVSAKDVRSGAFRRDKARTDKAHWIYPSDRPARCLLERSRDPQHRPFLASEVSFF
jgi:hypothetical protein